ncbi:MAG: hypothetical protein HY670_04505 [Chloroflexi bacterium]|nr:hypothetical protein [Chloroflexota bacterium]
MVIFGTEQVVSPSAVNREIILQLSQSPAIELNPISSPGITLKVHEPVETLSLDRLDSATILPSGWESGGWRLKTIMLVQIRREHGESIATIWLEGITEYGVADSDEKAKVDLVASLGEYRQCLEERQENLGESARKELEALKRLIEPMTPTIG